MEVLDTSKFTKALSSLTEMHWHVPVRALEFITECRGWHFLKGFRSGDVGCLMQSSRWFDYQCRCPLVVFKLLRMIFVDTPEEALFQVLDDLHLVKSNLR